MSQVNRTSYAILGFLRLRPMSGYDIKKACGEYIGHFWQESFGQIYPMLARLEQEGLVEPFPGRRSGKRSRREYRLTGPGRTALKKWLEQPAAPRMLRDELLLKLFCGSEAAPAIHLRHLREHRAAMERRLSQLRPVMDYLGDKLAAHPDRTHWHLNLRAGVLACEARLKWCDEAEELLSRLEARGSSSDNS